MGEKLTCIKNQPTVQEKDSQKLDENSFSHFSQTKEGLVSFENTSLKDFILSTEDFDDIMYTCKFISKKEIFLDISEQEEREEVRNLVDLFYKTFEKAPSISEINSIELDDSGFFIAYINRKNEQLDISWKKKDTDGHLFDEILKQKNKIQHEEPTEQDHYPGELRSTGMISSYLDEEDIPNVKFSGNASKGPIKYAPGYIENSRVLLEEYFKSKYLCDEVKIHS